MIRIMECSICSKVKRVNLILLDKNICTECEAKLVNVKVEDTSYHLYMDRIKDIISASIGEKVKFFKL